MSGQTVILAGKSQREFAHRLIDKAPDDAVVNIREATRTNDQNAYMWSLLSDIARAKPGGRVLPTEKWKALCMDAAGFKVDWEPGLYDGVVPCGYRSSRLSKADFAELLECILAFGAEHGIEWTATPENIS